MTRRIATLKSGSYEGTLIDGSRVTFHGIAARDRCDSEMAAKGYAPAGDWIDGERAYESDENLLKDAEYRDALTRAQRDYEMARAKNQGRVDLGPRPTLESIREKGYWSPPIVILTDEQRAEAAAAVAQRTADFKRYDPQGSGTASGPPPR